MKTSKTNRKNELIEKPMESINSRSSKDPIYNSLYYKNKRLCKIKVCKSIIKKATGLMFRSFTPLVFVFKKEKLVPLHMVFVFYPIDVIYLDKNNFIVEVKESFKPFSFYNPINKAMYVLELEDGIISKQGIKVGEKLDFKTY